MLDGEYRAEMNFDGKVPQGYSLRSSYLLAAFFPRY